MNPDAWMPYYGGDFNDATRLWPREIKWSYLDAIWFYWSHTKCDGIPDDDDCLRRLCGCDLSDWQKTKGTIFSGQPFFYLENGKWHQKRARNEYAKVLELSRRSAIRPKPLDGQSRWN